MKKACDKGDIIEFGRYDDGNGINPIKWRILVKDENKALLITEYGIDCGAFDDFDVEKDAITWETWELRKWLNYEFYHTAFSDEEKKYILLTNVTANIENDTIDKVFFLSESEVIKYFDSAKKSACKPTGYAVSGGVYINDDNGNCEWWLRSPGFSNGFIENVDTYGKVNPCGNGVNDDSIAFRPALWINVNALNCFKNFKEESSDIADESIKVTCLHQTAEKISNNNAGIIVEFGMYDDGNGINPIKWKVLVKEGNKALLITEYGIDCKKYNEQKVDITWESCTLRKWLNNDFFNTAFSEEEKKMISVTNVTADRNSKNNTSQGNNTQDKVYLLSIKEARKYFASDAKRRCSATEYAVLKGDFNNKCNGKCQWWLRTSGINSAFVATVRSDGIVHTGGNHVVRDNIAVRPVLWINLESIIFE